MIVHMDERAGGLNQPLELVAVTRARDSFRGLNVRCVELDTIRIHHLWSDDPEV